MENKLEIKYLSLDEIVPYVNNAKVHPQEQIDQLKASILEFGMCNPILIHNKTIVAGHGRVMALKQLKIDKVPTIDLSHLSDVQRKGYILADNKTSEKSTWDDELLKLEIETLYKDGFDLDLTGFDDFEIQELDCDFDLFDDGIESGGVGACDVDDSNSARDDTEDEVPNVEEKPIIKMGDLIELGDNFQHRVLCGDSTKEEDVNRLMGGVKADMVFTDPPYGVSYQNNQTKKHKVIKNDDVFLDEWIPLVGKHSKGFIFMWTSYQVLGEWLIITEPFGKLTNMVIWSKGGGGLGDLKGAFATDFEIALVWNRKETLKDKRIGSVWSIGKDNVRDYLHPTQKPVELMEKGIFNCTNINQIVLDLFLGSGSTLIASENLNRKCYGIELDEKYAQVIVQRYVNYTTNPKIKINGKIVDWEKYLSESTNG